MIKRQSIGEEKAIQLSHSQWWVGQEPKNVAKFQLLTDELCMPFSEFHKNLELALGRPVFTHELALNYDGIVMQLFGEADPPTLEQIINLIPEEKRIILTV